jgi:hypothetical protein
VHNSASHAIHAPNPYPQYVYPNTQIPSDNDDSTKENALERFRNIQVKPEKPSYHIRERQMICKIQGLRPFPFGVLETCCASGETAGARGGGDCVRRLDAAVLPLPGLERG